MLYYPHYRNGIFAKLSASPEFVFHFYGGKGDAKLFLQTDQTDRPYLFFPIWTKQIRIPFTKKKITLQPFAVWALLTKKYDIYVMSQDVLRPSVWFNLAISRILGKKVCLWGQGQSYPPNAFTWKLRKIMFRLADAVIFYTENVRNLWIQEGLEPKKLFVAYNSLDTDTSEFLMANLTESDLELFQKEHDLYHKKVIVFSGRLILDWKKPHLLIKAMQIVVTKHPEARAILIGDGGDRKYLESLVQELKLQEFIKIWGACYDESVIAKIMLSGKIFVVPGNGGLSIQHALGYGLPVITNDNIENQSPEIELIIPHRTGLFFAENNFYDLANKICYLLENENIRQQMSNNALDLIRTKYNVNMMAEGFFRAFRYVNS